LACLFWDSNFNVFSFQIYKIPDGKPENQFAFNGEAKNAAFATNVVTETHRFWQSLVKKEVEAGKISCVNTCVDSSPDLVSGDQAEELLTKSPEGGDQQALSDLGKSQYSPLSPHHTTLYTTLREEC
jgi:hypothetical protein